MGRGWCGLVGWLQPLDFTICLAWLVGYVQSLFVQEMLGRKSWALRSWSMVGLAKPANEYSWMIQIHSMARCSAAPSYVPTTLSALSFKKSCQNGNLALFPRTNR